MFFQALKKEKKQGNTQCKFLSIALFFTFLAVTILKELAIKVDRKDWQFFEGLFQILLFSLLDRRFK